ncbi:penicillin-binding transpeptidase domain-containing protein [Blastomonas sp. UPD001]|uniref:transglycosylase domain-containing protein n=1 Tax=Blastomonas sp. UPD001 TaxID=2217673 RepID=UPI000E34FF34|nr:penicillin-binding transpeptidase domain-containing protein [Blastomonas sp. UPD001]
MADQNGKFSLSNWLKNHLVGMIVFSLLTGIVGNGIFAWMTSPAESIQPSASNAASTDPTDATTNESDLGADRPDAQTTNTARPRPLMLAVNGSSMTPLNGEADEKGVVRHFMDWVRPEVLRLTHGHKGPLIVETTLDLNLEHAAAGALQTSLPTGATGAALTLDRSGAVLVMVAGANSFETPNLTLNALRDSGSSWRTFVYLAALRQGYTPATIVMDSPVTINGWKVPGNRYGGEMSIRSAFAYAPNAVTMMLAQETGHDAVVMTARRLGITTPISRDVTMPLGSSKVRMIELARALAIVSEGGKQIEPFGVTKISTMTGQVIYSHTLSPAPAMAIISPDAAAAMTDLMQSAAAIEQAKPAQFGRPFAGLIGESLDAADSWFSGFSSGVTTCVWLGRPDGGPVDADAGRLVARAFGRIMRVATAGRPKENFDTPLTLPEWRVAR